MHVSIKQNIRYIQLVYIYAEICIDASLQAGEASRMRRLLRIVASRLYIIINVLL